MRSIVRKAALAAAAAFLILLLSGCAQISSINRRAIIQAIGLDWEGDVFSATLEYFAPKGSGDQFIDVASPNSDFASGSGVTIESAIKNAALPRGKDPFYAQSSIVVIGRRLAEERLGQVVDFINQDPALRANTELFIAEQNASDVIGRDVDLGVLPGETIRRIHEVYASEGLMADETVEYYHFVNRFCSEYLSAALPMIRAEEKGKEASGSGAAQGKTLSYIGTAVVRGEKLCCSLDLSQTRGVLFLTDQLRSTSVDTVLPDGTPLSARIVSSGTAVRPVVREGEDVAFFVRIENRIRLQEYPPAVMSADSVGRREVDEAIRRIVERECSSAWDVLMKEHRADALGYGNLLRLARPDLSGWLAEHWEQTLPSVRCELEVVNVFE